MLKIGYINDMMLGSKGHEIHACMNLMTLGPVEHEKAARLGRILNVFRIVEARSAEQSAASRE